MLSAMILTAVLRRIGHGDITVHGFRSTFRDWCAEAVGNAFAREMCKHAMAHGLLNKVEAAYRRGDLFDKLQRVAPKEHDVLHLKQQAMHFMPSPLTDERHAFQVAQSLLIADAPFFLHVRRPSWPSILPFVNCTEG